ncbi:MAG: hypothetical protein ACRYF2_17620 [Janthinobacterium lividum]
MAAALTLGDIVFSDFEVPEHFVVGGKQRLVIHSLPGGGRVVDAMGADDAPIRWSGVFSGQQAAERVRAIERLRRGGQRQTLTWDAWLYSVVVQEFQAEVTSSWWIPYQIKLCIVLSGAGTQTDWFDRATGPALSIGVLGVAALETAIGVAGLGLASADIGQSIGAAGDLAQYVTSRAYGLGAA